MSFCPPMMMTVSRLVRVFVCVSNSLVTSANLPLGLNTHMTWKLVGSFSLSREEICRPWLSAKMSTFLMGSVGMSLFSCEPVCATLRVFVTLRLLACLRWFVNGMMGGGGEDWKGKETHCSSLIQKICFES